MNFDFPTILVLATFVTGGIWFLDALLFAPGRRRRFIASGALTGMDGKRPRPHEPWPVEYSRSFFPVILIVLVLRSFLAEPFRIPSGSMMPTLLVGDFILVNKYAYGIRLPVLNQKVMEVGLPQRGDVVVFRYPRNPKVDYIKRVVGLPGDRIAYRNKTLFINGEPQKQTPVGEYVAVGAGSRMTGAKEGIEYLGERSHSILVNTEQPDFSPGCQVLMFGEVEVPAGHYFAMGDNRDNSNDSRCWGMVPEENLVGRAFGIWMSFDAERSGNWFAWERIGKGIE